MPNDPSKDYYYMLRNTPNTESIIVEYGFLDSKQDDVNQLKDNYENYAEAVVRALVDYIGATYIPIVGQDYYIVEKGDSLWSIARKLNTSVDELKKANNLVTNNLSIGQVLKIPGSSSDAISKYTVQSGDTLYNIANKFGVTIQDLINMNNLSTTNLSVGQELKINAEPLINQENTYVVTKGDTLYSIAKTYNLSVQDLIDANNLKSSSLSIGQKIVIPTYDVPGGKLYTVVNGDTLSKIASRYGVAINELKQLNNLNNDLLSVGQVLKIPSTDNYLAYTVEEGDNLYKISRKYNTTVTDIQSLNNLTTSVLTVGQKLLIPSK